MGGMDAHDEHKYRQDLENISKTLNLQNDKDLDKAHNKFYRYHTWDHFSRFKHAILEISGIDRKAIQELNSFVNYEGSTFPSKQKILEVLGSSVQMLEEPHKELLEDYVHYMKHHTLRRAEALSNEY